MSDLKAKYASTVNLTVTNLHSLASSQSWIAGWGSLSYANTSNLYQDYLYGGTFTTHASNRQAGDIYGFVVAFLNDTPTIPAVSSGALGTEGAIAFADTYRRDALVRPLFHISVDNTASAIYTFPQTGIAQLFGYRCPTHHCIFIAQNCATTTAAGFASSGSAIYQTPVYDQSI